jgi:hypothetical protein
VSHQLGHLDHQVRLAEVWKPTFRH